MMLWTPAWNWNRMFREWLIIWKCHNFGVFGVGVFGVGEVSFLELLEFKRSTFDLEIPNVSLMEL